MIKPEDCWIETFTGKKFHLITPSPDEVDILDIAHSLSMQCRYTGMTSKHYNICDHSIRVASLVPEELKLAALLHDASEAYLSDISRPLKKTLLLYKELEYAVQGVIQDKYGIGQLSLGSQDLIKKADDILLVTEARDLLPKSDYKSWGINEEPLTGLIEPLSMLNSYGVFLGLFNKYCQEKDRVTHVQV